MNVTPADEFTLAQSAYFGFYLTTDEYPIVSCPAASSVFSDTPKNARAVRRAGESAPICTHCSREIRLYADACIVSGPDFAV